MPSTYILDLVVDDVRYEYGFSVLKGKVECEWLNAYPHGRRRILVERDPHSERELSFSRELPGDNATAARTARASTLFLSSAANV
jgi:hypothetical protein